MKGGIGETMTLTEELLSQLSAKRLPTEPPDGWATPQQIADAAGLAYKTVHTRLKAAVVDRMEIRTPTGKMAHAYNLAQAIERGVV